MSEERMESMTAEAVRAKEEFLLEYGAKCQGALDEMKAPVFIENKYGEQYIAHDGKCMKLEKPKPDHIIKAGSIETYSLNGLVDYIRLDPEGIFHKDGARHIVMVMTPERVKVIAPQKGYWREREEVAQCCAVVPDIKFGRYMDTDEFQIMVQTCFLQDENREKVLQLAGSVKKEQGMQTADDGVSQKVTINSGVSTAADVIIRNPVTLIPYRTFREVEQPESPFVLRFDKEGRAALFTGDSSKWQLEAVENIKGYLMEKLKDEPVDIIA